jgi:hypothetical protein
MELFAVKIDFIEDKKRGEISSTGGNNGAIKEIGGRQWQRSDNDAEEIEIGGEKVDVSGSVTPAQFSAAWQPSEDFTLDDDFVTDHMPGAALDAHGTTFAIGKSHFNGDAVVGDDDARSIVQSC